MDQWPQRAKFKEALRSYQEKTGKSQEQVAQELGVSLTHLRNCLYRKDKRLGIDTLSAASGLFGCSVSEFVDDQGVTQASGESEIDRFMLRVMGSDIAKLTEQQKQSAFDAWRAIVRGYETR